VTIGEETHGADFVAAPAMLSRESGNGEINWSLGTYLTPKQVTAAVGNVTLPSATGVAPNQPWPHTGVWRYYGLLLAALFVAGIVMASTTETHKIAAFAFDVPSGKPPPPAEAPPGAEAGHVFFSEPFALRGGENIEIDLRAPLSNNWMYVVTDLVDESKGTFVTFDSNLEYYYGYAEGESWSEGSSTKTQTLGPLPAGNYVMRLEAQRGEQAIDAAAPIALSASIRQNVFQGGLWVLALLVLVLPGLFFFLSSRRFEKRRWENSGNSGSDDETDNSSDYGSTSMGDD
jgi:hypothetical protein